MSEYAERISAKDSNRRLVLQFRTDMGGARRTRQVGQGSCRFARLVSERWEGGVRI